MSTKRIGVARCWHESNTFSSALTDVEDFEKYQGGILVGAAMLNHPDRRDEIAGFERVLGTAEDIEIVPLISAGALPSGLITAAAVEMLENALWQQLEEAGPLDGALVAPHGAMAAEDIDDFDGHLLQIIRDQLVPDAPLVTALDCHAIVTAEMIDASTAIVAYRTHPHVDVFETGERAARVLLDALDGRTRPVVRTRHLPLIFCPPDDGTNAGALKELFDTFISWDTRAGVIACSLCPAFAWQDVPEQGTCAIAVTDGDPQLAQELADDLARRIWAARAHFQPEPMIPVAEAMRRAAETVGRPVVITDSADTVGGGAPGDNSVLLEQVLEQRGLINGLILAHLPDAPAIAELSGVQVGDTVGVAVGGKRDTRFCEPLPVTGRVECVTEGPIADDFGAGTTPTTETGPIICIAIDNVRLVLTERVIHGPQPSLFHKVGIDPHAAKVVTLKTGVGFKKAYAKVAAAVFRADCPGAESYDLCRYAFERVRRPMVPLEIDFEWEPGDPQEPWGSQGPEEPADPGDPVDY